MHTLLKALGWLMLVPGALFLLLSPFPLIQDGNGSAMAGLIMMGGLLAGPGGLLLRAGITRQRDEDVQDQMVGFVRSHESFSLEELAAHLGKSTLEAQTLLHRDIARYQLPLIMHRGSRRYMRLDRLARGGQVAERCQACGGTLDRQIIFEGEQLMCPYCSTLVVPTAPTQASWQQAQGAWQRQAWSQPQQQPAYQNPHYQQAGYQPQQYQQPPANQNQGGPWGHG